MLKRNLFIILCFMFSESTYSQLTDEKERLASKYASQSVDLVGGSIESIADQLASQLKQNLAKLNPNITDQEAQIVIDEMRDIMKEQLKDTGFFEEVLTSVYMKYFTLEELDQIVRFNDTPVGIKMLKVTGPLGLDVANLSTSLLNERMPSFIEELRERIRARELEIKM